jgi:type II secretory pathway component PulL
MHVNLLPNSFVLKRLVKQRLRQWSCVYGVIGMVMVLLYFPLLSQWTCARHDLRSYQIRSEPIRELQSQQIDSVKQTILIDQKVAQLRKTVMVDRSTALLGVVTLAIKDANKQIQLQEIQVTANEGQHRLAVRGMALEGEAITHFLESLQASKVFPRVELRSTQERMVSERNIQEFQVECLSNE